MKYLYWVCALVVIVFTFPGTTAASTTVLPVFGGGTGWANIQSNTLLTGNGGSALATTSVGTGLTLLGGVLSATGGSGGTGTIATSSADTAGELLYYTTNNGYPAKASDVATSSALCSGFITCSGFTVVGSVSPSITTTGLLGVASGGTGANTFGQGWLYSTGGTGALAASTSPTVNYISATSTTATSTFLGALSIQGNPASPHLYVGTSTKQYPAYGYLAGDTIDTEYDNNGFDLINTFNSAAGTCAGSGFAANGNILAVNSDYAALFFTNGGWTGSGCSFGNATERPESLVLAEPTGDMNFELASSSNAVSFKWYTQNTNLAMTLNNAAGLLTVKSASTTNITVSSSFLTGTAAQIGIASSSPSTNWGVSDATTTIIQNAGFANSIASSTTDNASQTVNWDNGDTVRFVLNQNTNFVINATSSVPRDGGKYILKLCQDPVGSRTATFVTPGQLRWANGTTTISSSANTCSLIGMIYDGSESLYDVIASSTGLQIN